jgi:hypothetical protein
VTKALLDRERKRATAVLYVDGEGREVEQPAEIVILCAFGLNNVNLLLNSGIGQPYDPATGQATVGRNYTYQTMASVSVFYPESVRINPFMGAGALGTAIDDYNGDNFDHTGLGFVGGGHIAAWTTTPRIRSVPSLIGLFRRSASSTSSIRGHWCSNGRARRCTPCRQGARCGLGSGTGRTHRDAQPRASTGATADTAGWGSPWGGAVEGAAFLPTLATAIPRMCSAEAVRLRSCEGGMFDVRNALSLFCRGSCSSRRASSAFDY